MCLEKQYCWLLEGEPAAAVGSTVRRLTADNRLCAESCHCRRSVLCRRFSAALLLVGCALCRDAHALDTAADFTRTPCVQS